MSSNVGNQEATRNNAEEHAHEAGGVNVSDKRRFTPEGELVVELDPPANEAASEAQQAEIEALQAKLKESEEKRAEAERQVREFADRFRKAQDQLKAENEEIRARMNRTFEQKIDAARGDLVAGLLDTLDNLKRAVAAAEKTQKQDQDFLSLLEGVRATAHLFEAKMQALGLTAVNSKGQEFNPELHEAVEIVAVSAEQDNKVIEEYQTGYKFGDRLLRPARVRVGRAS